MIPRFISTQLFMIHSCPGLRWSANRLSVKGHWSCQRARPLSSCLMRHSETPKGQRNELLISCWWLLTLVGHRSGRFSILSDALDVPASVSNLQFSTLAASALKDLFQDQGRLLHHCIKNKTTWRDFHQVVYTGGPDGIRTRDPVKLLCK
jgi:hypothetical protein